MSKNSGTKTLNIKRARKRGGQAIVESTVGLIVIVAIGVALVVLLLNVGTFFY
ncbi:MAG: hypothetical protein K2X27_22210 [Candidatus Obscuribacterales bacterium]|nr:hypothetical protein [Candidatus Obscuribacterales bacterium]